MSTDRDGIAAIVVTYHPDFDTLGTLFALLSPQVGKLIVVDNGTGPAMASWLATQSPTNLVTIALAENRGLAAAQNLGIAEARKHGMQFVLLSDQDSLPAGNMVEKLHAALLAARAVGKMIAAVGPRYDDIHQGGLNPFVRIRGLLKYRFDCTAPGTVVEVDHLISSGSLIPIEVLDDIGNMAEELFIDYIDTEWCLRAWRNDYALLGVCDATMRHGLGDQPNYFCGRYVPVHKPFRHYYLFRNALWLMGRPGLPIGWKIATLRRLILVFGYFMLLGPQRFVRLRMMTKGFYDGLRKRMGPMPG